jgi:hypothetical protein
MLRTCSHNNMRTVQLQALGCVLHVLAWRYSGLPAMHGEDLRSDGATGQQQPMRHEKSAES